MLRTHPATWNLLVGFLAALCISCAPAPVPKYKVTGTVTFDGDPIEEGTLIFYPAEEGSDADVATIKAGKYETRVKPGTKRVEITAQREMPDKIGPYGDPEMEQFIPADFNRESKLQAEVAPVDNNILDFELESSGE